MKKYYNYLLYISIISVVVNESLYMIFGSFMEFVQWFSLIIVAFGVPRYLLGKEHNRFLTFSLILALLLITYFIVTPKVENSTTHLKNCLFPLFSALLFFTGRFNEKQTKRFFWILSILSIISLFDRLTTIRLVDDNAYGGGYLALICLPLGLYNLRHQKLYIRLIWIFFIMVVVMNALKRGDILALGVSLIIYFLFVVKTESSRKIFRYYFLIIIAIVIGVLYFNYFLESSELARMRYEQTIEGNSSERDIIYTAFWNHFVNSPIETKVIGNGFSSTVTIGHIVAHNDWLELLIDEGLLGVSLYLMMFLSLFGFFIKGKIPNSFRPVLAMTVGIFLVKSAFSMMIFSLPSTALFSLIGYILNPHTMQTERNYYEKSYSNEGRDN